MAEIKTFNIRITDTTPETLGMSDLGEILMGLEKSIRAMIPTDNTDLIMGVVGLSRGSTAIEVYSNRPTEAQEAVNALGEAVMKKRPEILPKSARQGLQQVMPVLRKHVTDIKRPSLQLVASPDIETRPSGIITTEMDFEYEPPQVSGHTTIYGSLMWIGGKHPRAHVHLDSGQSLNCHISHVLARELATRLYQEVGLEGEAVWNSEDWTIQSFKIMAVTGFVGGPITKAFDDLAEVVGDAWGNVDDVNEEIRRMRQEDSQ